MTRPLRWSVLVLLALPLFGAAPSFAALRAATTAGRQDSQDPREREERIRRRVAEALDGELRHLRDALGDTVRQAVGGGGLDLVTEDLLRRHAFYLASDELEGRNAGWPGNDKACAYIAEQMKKAGLAPAGDKDDSGAPTYFQHFDVRGRRTQNCLGLLEGSDPELRKELVVIGAHHDHVGTEDQRNNQRLGRSTADDKIWNGADDNGSGTTSVLGLIKAFGEGGIRTKRTILFMTFSGEEEGLLGSIHYCKNPILPIKRHAFMLNMDMVGRNPEEPCEILGWGTAEGSFLREAEESAVKKTGLSAKLKERSEVAGGDSDHSSFKRAGVPVAFIHTGLHADYHAVGDSADKLDYPHMVLICRTAADILIQVGNAPARPVFNSKSLNSFNFDDPRPSTPPAPPRRVLGITKGTDLTDAELDKIQALKPGEGVIRIDVVNPGGPAEKAGLKTGDLLVSLGGRSFLRRDALTSLRDAIGAAEAGREIDAEVIREGKRMTLKVRFEN